MIDQREIAIAVGFARLGDGVPDRTPAGPLLEAFRAAIEAYEAALWRPIEEFDEQPPDDPNGVVFYRGELYLARGCAVVRNAMYRTMAPPSPVSGSPAADTDEEAL